jgi:hypothetical protein
MTTKFTAAQIETLREQFGKIQKVHPDNLQRFRDIFARCDDSTLLDLAKAKIKFVSLLAVNACARRGIEIA